VSHAPGPTAATGPGDTPTTTTSGSTEVPSSSTGTGGGGAGGNRATTSSKDKTEQFKNLAAKSAVGADDSLLLVALVLGFTFAVSGVVVAAGLRGGRRVR